MIGIFFVGGKFPLTQVIEVKALLDSKKVSLETGFRYNQVPL